MDMRDDIIRRLRKGIEGDVKGWKEKRVQTKKEKTPAISSSSGGWLEVARKGTSKEEGKKKTTGA